MPNLINNVQSIYNTFSDIKQALEDKGVEIPDYTPVTAYPNYITGAIGETHLIRNYRIVSLETVQGGIGVTTLQITGTTTTEVVDNMRQAIANIVVGKDDNDNDILFGTVDGEYIKFEDYLPKIRVYLDGNNLKADVYYNGSNIWTASMVISITISSTLSCYLTYQVTKDKEVCFWITNNGNITVSGTSNNFGYCFYRMKCINLYDLEEQNFIGKGYSSTNLYYSILENTSYQQSSQSLSSMGANLSLYFSNSSSEYHLLIPIILNGTPYVAKNLYLCTYPYTVGDIKQDGAHQYLVIYNYYGNSTKAFSFLLQIN